MNQRRGLEIRTATEADAPGLAKLLGGGDRDAMQRGLAIAGRLGALGDGAGTALIALDWGPPVGLVALHWFASLDADRPIGQIDMLLVDPDDRRRGIGRLLVKAAAQAARIAGCGRLDLVVGEDQAGLRAFCAATGFAETGCRVSRALRKSAG